MRLQGLVATPAGELVLSRLPALAPPFLQPAGDLGWSGLALDQACGLYVADTSGNRLIGWALDCDSGEVLPGQPSTEPAAATFDGPAGLAVGPQGWLYVADSGSGRILVLSRSEMAVRDTWPGFVRPVAVAATGDSGVVVLDAGAHEVRCFDAFGTPNESFNAAVAAAGMADPRAIAVDESGVLYVADGAAGSIFRFDGRGSGLGALAVPGIQARALAAGGGLLYAGDSGSGQIVIVSTADGQRVGSVASFSGPVTALAVSRDGVLFIKPALDSSWIRVPGVAHVTRGVLEAGPLDAGALDTWLRVKVSARVNAGQRVGLSTFVSESAAGPPVWEDRPAMEGLLQPGRYLWIRVEATTRDALASPLISQVEAETPGDSYADYLPAVYSRDQDTGGFLLRLLEAARSMLGGLEDEVGELPRLYRADVAPARWLDWLASWVAFRPPSAPAADDDPADFRTLLESVMGLYGRRGTPRALRDFVEIYGGARPHLFEAFRERAIWILDRTSTLDFDTRLAGTDPEGLIVGDASIGAAGPEPLGSWGSTLFDRSAHRFTAVVAAAEAPTEDSKRIVRSILEEERPAHTGYHVCFAEPRLRVGVQARIGVDAIVAGDPPAAVLDQGDALNRGAYLDTDRTLIPGRVGQQGRLGLDTRLG